MAILTITELRKSVEYPTGSDADDALQLLLNASETAIVERAGASGDVTELVSGGWPQLILTRPAASITSVTEDFDYAPVVLATDDYRYIAGGYVLHRLATGTNPSHRWRRTIQVVYTPVGDLATRSVVQIALVRLFLNHHPGLTYQMIGDWTEKYADATMDYAVEQDLILSTLVSDQGMVVVDDRLGYHW